MIYDRNPTTASHDIVFKGSFDFNSFDKHWLYQNQLISKSEVKEFKQYLKEDYTRLEFEDMQIFIKLKEIKFKTYSIHLLNKLFEFAISFLRKINFSKSLLNINLNNHFPAESTSIISNGLKKLTPIQNWGKIISNPSIEGAMLKNSSKQKNYTLNQSIIISECNKYNKQYHVFIENSVSFSKNVNLVNFKNDFNKIINKCIEISNFVANEYFTK